MNAKTVRPQVLADRRGAEFEASNKSFLPSPDAAVNSASSQRARLLAALRNGPLTTLEARRLLDVLHPAARVMELRQLGHNIVTAWDTDITSEGNPHRVARYLLKGVAA